MKKEIKEMTAQADAFQEQVKDLAHESVKAAPAEEVDQQTKMSKREMQKYDAPYIKWERSIACKEAPNPKFQQERDYMWEYVRIVAENHEIIGESIEMWTKQYPGDAYHFWRIPVNKPVWVPRLVAERLSKCSYVRYVMEDASQTTTGSDGYGTYYTGIKAKHVKQRLNAIPAGGFGKASSF